MLNAVLFLRPADLIADLGETPIYEAVIVCCLAVSFPGIVKQLSLSNLAARPITVGVVGLLPAVVLSHLARGSFYDARFWGTAFVKIVLYYLLLVAVLDTPSKLRFFVSWLGVLILALTALVLLQYQGAINLPALEAIQDREIDPETGFARSIPRLCGVGIFHDPNDLSVILGVGMVIGLSRLAEGGGRRMLWLLAIGLMGYALTLTQSRGGLLALLAGLFSLCATRFGVKKSFLLGLALIPGLLFFVGGRLTNFDLGNSNDTSQHRIKLWSEGLQLLLSSPVFGIGAGRYEEEVGLVAHNSFVHAYTELGIVGGTFFLGAFFYAIATLFRLSTRKKESLPTALESLSPYILAMVVVMAAGMMSLSRVYTLPPFALLGVATVYLNFARFYVPASVLPLTQQRALQFSCISIGFLVIAYVFIRTFAVWS